MGNNEILTDDYVAALLAEEAKDCSLKYSTLGMEAFRATKPASKLKPNTRFLRNIIQGTKTHNEALFAKGAAESQARLRELADAEEERQRKYKPEPGEMRGRQLGNIAALLHRQKRGRGGLEDTFEQKSKRDVEDARQLADTAVSQRRRDRNEKHRRSLKRYDSRKKKDRDDFGSEMFVRRRTSSGEEDHGKDYQKRRDRSRSPRTKYNKSRHRSPLADDKSIPKLSPRFTKSHHRRRSIRSEPLQNGPSREAEDADSDPLEDIIGPAAPPQVLPRGRGVLRGSSRMDSRFADDYDPASDMQPGVQDGDDWGEALQALRDRNQWKRQGADRLRAAGFTEEQVKKWERGGEKNEQDVRWSKAGEKREWDRGKTLDLDEL